MVTLDMLKLFLVECESSVFAAQMVVFAVESQKVAAWEVYENAPVTAENFKHFQESYQKSSQAYDLAKALNFTDTYYLLQNFITYMYSARYTLALGVYNKIHNQ